MWIFQVACPMRRNEKKLVFEDPSRKLIQRLLKVESNSKDGSCSNLWGTSEISSVDLIDHYLISRQWRQVKPERRLQAWIQGLVCCHCPSSCSLYFLVRAQPIKTVQMFPAKPLPEARAVLRTRPSSWWRERRVQWFESSEGYVVEPIKCRGPKEEQSRIDLIVSKRSK